MIEIKINGVVKWQVNEYTFNDPQMGIRSINMTVKHPSMWVDSTAPDTADFTGAYVDYEGEKYSISSSKPTAEKSNTSLDYIYTLIFKGEEDELTRRKVRNLALVSFDNYVSQGTTFSIYADINQFKQLLENNLKHYFGNKWSINLSVLSSDSVRIDVSNVTLWDLLSKTYEYFGVRFNIRGNVINIGYEPEEIYHVFDYGSDGGLVKITKTAPDTSIVNRLSGVGGSRNVPMNYFTDRYSEFPPDPNPINSSVNIRNIMPKVFRDSVVLGDYKDYVEDLASVASHGVREDALAPNEDIYPSIAGVEVSGLGRIDEIIAVSEVIADKPDDENYSPTFHIWVKDIGFNLADEQYTSTQDAKISFTTGVLTGYEFTILANGKIREVVEDTTKSFNGVSSKYRITLINSDEDFDATGRVLPNTVLKPSAGDHFVIYDIEMPFSYVANAEQRVQDWLEANLADLKEEKPTFSIEPMSSFFETAPVEFDGKTIKEKLRAGNKITINADTEQKLHINNLTIQYGGLMPKYSFTVTDKVQVQGGTVARMQSQLDGVMSRQLLTERDRESLLSGLSTKFLSKIKPDTAQGLITFLRGLTAEELSRFKKGVEFGEFSSNIHTGTGGLIDKDGNAELQSITSRSFIETPVLKYNQLELIGDELAVGAGAVIEEIEQISETDYRLKLKLEGGDFNPIHQSDILKGIYSHKTSWMGVISETDAESPWIRVTVPTDELVHGGRNFPPVQFMTLAKWGNFTDKERQTTLFFSAKDGNIRIFSGVNNYKAGYLNTQVGKANGLEFIRNWENLPVNPEHGAVYADTLFYNKKIKVDYEGEVIKEYPDRGEWSLETATNNPYLFNGIEEHEVWYQSEKFRVSELGNETLEKPSRTSPYWVLILSIKDYIDANSIAPTITEDGFWAFWDKELQEFVESEFSAVGDDGHAPIIRDGYWYEWNPDSTKEDKYEPTGVRAEGVKGDGAIEKFKSSATQPSTPTGEAEDWDDEPTQNQEILLEPTGNNLYDRNYLLAQGWTEGGLIVYKMDAGSGEIVVPSNKFKANKQYRVQGQFNGGGLGSTLTINYSSGLPWEIMSQDNYSVNEITDKNRTVQSITISYGNPSISNSFTVFELIESGTKNLPIWVSRKTIKDGVESSWSTPVKWTGEDGEKGKDGTGVNVIGSADTWNSLPTSGNNLNDARIVQDTGVLAVWNGTKWVEAGEIKGPAGDTPYIGGNGNWWIGGTDTGIKAKGDKGDKGDKGNKGDKGEKGDGVRILGSFNTPSELSGISNPALGDGYMINGDLWVYVGGSIHTPPAPVGWNNVGRIKGDKGKDGSSYLVLGYWSPDYEYQISDAGIPVVKRPGSTTFLAYKLIVPKSTVGQFINTGTNKEWELVDSSEFTYMLEAYIEVLQAELITAEKIEALDITARKLKTPSTVVTTANFQSQLIQANSVIIQDRGLTPITYDWNTVYLPNGEQYDGLKAQIYAPTGTYKRIRIKTSDGGLLFINNTEIAVGKIELAFTTAGTIHLTAMWNPTYNVLDWIITYYHVYRVSNAVQTNGKRLPVILWSGDNLFSGTIPKSGVLPTDSLGVLTTINSNWHRGFTCSKDSGNMYSIKVNTPFHYGSSSSVSPRQTITSGDIEVSINPTNTFSPINTYIVVYGHYDYTEIRVWFSNPSTPSTYIEQDFAITVRANRPIVQDEYLTPTLD